MRIGGRGSGSGGGRRLLRRAAGAPRGGAPKTGAGLEVRPYAPGDEDALVAIFSSTFHRRSVEEWRWLFSARPDGRTDIDIRVLTTDGRIVGAVSHIGTDVWVAGERRRLAMGADMMVVPECRGRGGAEMLIRSFRDSDHGFDMNFGTVNAGSRRVTKRHMGTAVLGFVPVWVRIGTRAPGRSATLRALASAPERVLGARLSLPRPRATVVELDTLGPELDRLAEDSASFATCIRVRDSSYVRWHWAEDPRTPWRLRGVWGEGGVLRGYAVSGVKAEGAARRGLIADLVARDPDALRALVLDAYERLIAEGCVAVTCTYRDPRRWAHLAMLRCGFRRALRLGPRVACGPLSPRADDAITHVRSWYLTTADTDL
jgi:hypothetical protein